MSFQAAGKGAALFLVLVVSSQILIGCGAGAKSSGDGAQADGSSASGGGRDCSNVTTAGWELFVDPRLTIQPTKKVYPLEKGDSISFRDSTPKAGGYTTYSYQTAQISDEGTAFPNRSGGFPEADGTGVWTLKGPFAAHGVDGGPYMGILQIDATNSAGIKTIARLCVALAKDE